MFNISKLRSIGCLRNINQYFGNNNRRTCLKSKSNRDLYLNKFIMAAPLSNLSNSSQTTNRLIYEKSPYLLQHATNPVDWYPWCDEAIERAKCEDKLIFLSVGYSTCHWCHVMEKESFENEEIAEIMNENYINIKVDREERPDIDKIYMSFVMMINGSGGWPMSVWLTPDLAPVTAGTYFPPQDRWGMIGFKTILTKVAEKWQENRSELVQSGKHIIKALQKNVNERGSDGEILSIERKFKQAVTIYRKNFDENWGGWGRQPKFPEVSKLNFLLHAHFRKPKDKIADMVLLTLDKLARGGIHDHIFGGFSRYSVDRKWHVPHFEKMLYDQAQLLSAYANAYLLTRNKFYLDICKNIVRYLCTDLKHPLGGFYSGEDADSLPNHNDTTKIEGAFYAWTASEIRNAFDKNKEEFNKINTNTIDPYLIYSFHYDITEEGNVEPASDPHGHILGKNILFVKRSLQHTAKHFNLDHEIIKEILKIGNKILYEIRCKRPRPHLDTKIICSWNGLVLAGLSRLACISDLNEDREKCLNLCKNLIEFIKKHLYNTETKTLLRSCYGEGLELDSTTNVSHPIEGFLDDYAFLIKGLLEYYIATLDVNVLHWAFELQKKQDELFWDNDNGAYYYSQANTPNVIVRLKEDHDGAEPCANSVSIHNLMLLNTYFEDGNLKERVKKMLTFYEGINPFGYVLPHMLSGLLLYDYGIQMLVIVGPDNDESKAMFDVVRDYFIPGLVPIQVKTDRLDELTRKSAVQFKMIRNKPTVYICHNQVCQMPITDPNELRNCFNEKFLYNCDILNN